MSQTKSGRHERFLQTCATTINPRLPFASPSLESIELFHEGHYLGCIYLTQAILEAVINHLYLGSVKRKPTKGADFEKQIRALHKKGIITEEWKSKLNKLSSKRGLFQYFTVAGQPDDEHLEQVARSSLSLLIDIERQLFAFSVSDDIIIPAHPEYWTSNVAKQF